MHPWRRVLRDDLQGHEPRVMMNILNYGIHLKLGVEAVDKL